jgi:hypothetical protein
VLYFPTGNSSVPVRREKVPIWKMIQNKRKGVREVNSRNSKPTRKKIAAWLSILILAALVLPYAPATATTSSPETPDAPGLTWLTETVDTAEKFENMSSRSIRLDSNGNPGIVFGSRKLYMARYSGTAWSLSIVDGSYGVGAYASLDFDSNNRPHISYYDAINGKLKYATYLNNVWVTETVNIPGSANMGLYTSIEMDSNDRPHISMYDAVFQELVYVSRNTAGSWVGTVVNSVGSVGKYTSLALDRNDVPYISYYNETNDALMLAYPESGIWRNDFIDARLPADPEEQRGVGLFTSLAVDSRGVVHISYHNAIRGDLMYARVDSSGRSSEIVEHINGEVVGLFTSIAVDNNRVPRISYFSETLDDLKYAELTDDGWETETVFSDGRTGLYTSLAINLANNRPFISYYDFGTNEMKLAQPSSGGWSDRVLATAGTTGVYVSMELDSNNYPHIAYFDDSSSSLRYARWTGTGWERWELDTRGAAGLYATLALDSNDYPHIAYYSAAVNELLYIRWTGTKWTGTNVDNDNPSIVDTNGDVGKYASIDLDSSNIPHISYAYTYLDGDDNLRSLLKYATWNGTSWVTSVVDNSGDTGFYSSIAIGPDNAPRIAYFEEQNDEARYAYYVPASSRWEFEIIDPVGSVGTYMSLAVDPFGVAHVSYYDFTPFITPRLKYAVRTGVDDWWTTVVDGEALTAFQLETNPYFSPNAPDVVDGVNATGGVGMYSSIALDSLNRPHISYYNATDGDLKYAFWSGSGWQLRTVYSQGDAGQFSSIDIGSNDLPHIAFHDKTERELKYTRAATLNFQVYIPTIIR